MKQHANHKIQKVRTLIVDDEPEAINILKMLAGDIETIEITGTTCDPDKVLSAYLKATPDLLLLDIHLGTRTGFEVLQELHEHKLYPLVIFTTAHDQYLLKAIRAGAFDYLLKPVDRDQLAEALNKAKLQIFGHSLESRIELLEKSLKNHRKLSFSTRSGLILIHPDEIFYLEADASYTEIYLTNEKREIVSMNIGSVIELLPEQFIRISRSIILNTHYLVKISGTDMQCSIKVNSYEMKFKVPDRHIAELRRLIGEI